MIRRRKVAPPIFLLVVLTASVCVSPVPALAQKSALARDSLSLAELQSQAVQRDPRARQLDLLASQSALRQQNIGAARLPTVGAIGQAQYQSDVVTLPFQLPGGVSVPAFFHDTYDASLLVQQPLYDRGIGARRGIERAQLAASQASVQASLFTLRQSVNDAYFAALMQQLQSAEQNSAITDLEAQLRVANNRVQHGTALPSEAEMLEAEVLRRRQAVAELVASRDASLAILSDLAGHAVASADALAIPDLSASVARVRSALDTLRTRPEYQQFALSREVLTRQQASLGAADLPRVLAFGRAGYGRPGLNPFARDFDSYWLAGVKVDWSPWNWGTTRREQQALTLQQQMVASDEAAFQKSVRRGVTRSLASIDQLQHTLVDDDTIVALRERILRETRFRFAEGVITSAEYVDRETDLLNARLARVMHNVQLAEARANLLTSLGIETR